MPGLLIKNVPLKLQRRLKTLAARHHRSLMREALALLEEAVMEADMGREFPRPFKGRFPITDAFIQRAKSEGRA